MRKVAFVAEPKQRIAKNKALAKNILRTTGRRLCEGFCLLQNRQMYEVPQGEYIALESRRPDVRKPTLWAVIGRDFVHRERASRGAGQLTMNFGRGKNLQPAKIFRARLSTPHLAKPMLCDVLSFPIIFRFFCFDKVNNFFLSHGKSPTKS